MKIDFYVGSTSTWEPVQPGMLETGAGGSEIALIQMAMNLTALGHEVTVWGDQIPPPDPGYGTWLPRTAWNPQVPADVLVFWRQPPQIPGFWRLAAKQVWLWFHDIMPITLPPSWADRISRVVVLSDYHKWTLSPQLQPKAVIIPNGLEPAFYTDANVRKTRNHFFYSSSPRRGLKTLLDQWPGVMLRHPDARLHVAYGFDLPIEIAKRNEPHLVGELVEMKSRVETMPGVIAHGRVGQEELAKIQLGCTAWLYPPNDFKEVHCITALEAQAAYCVPVSRSGGALDTTLGHFVEWKPDVWLTDLIPLVREFPTDFLTKNRNQALRQTWRSIAQRWQELFT